MSALTSASFKKLVQTLKHSKKTCTVVEQCCGGTINASILAQPGASSVYLGGSVIYNTKKGGKSLLFNNESLYQSLTNVDKINCPNDYIQSKFDWTAKTSVAFCEALGTDYAVAEGGAAGPTFRFDDMKSGFTVLTIAGKKKKDYNGDDNNSDEFHVLKQTLVRSTHANREKNMRLFADAAADLLVNVMEEEKGNVNDENITNEKEEEIAPSSKIILDRATKLRSDEETLTKLEKSSAARYVIVQKGNILLRSPTELAMLSYEEIKPHLKSNNMNNNSTSIPNQQTFLGLLSDKSKTPIFGIDILDDNDGEINSLFGGGYYFDDTRTSAPLLPPLENELALHIMAYANWQRNSRFCASTGSPLKLIHAGTTQQSTDTGKLSWPRQDPSMIASITSRCGERILLAHSKRHPPKLHTVLAGFVEAGETFEAAVAREVFEETGIRIDEDSVKYIGSQPWPFPQSCMIAFTATADDSQTMNIDEDEIVHAKWYDRDEVIKATQVQGAVMKHDVAKVALEEDPSLNLLVPPKGVIARTLIDKWLENR